MGGEQRRGRTALTTAAEQVNTARTAGRPDAGRAAGRPADRNRVPRSVWHIAITLAAGSVMSGLDTSLVNVGLNSIGRSLHSSLATTQWINSGYLLALAAALPVCVWIGRRFGAGRLWLWALAGFTVFSGLCALAPNIQILVAARMLQGLAGGLLIPAGMTILGEVADRGHLGRVIAISSVPSILAPAVGPVVGSLILAHASWSWLFLINIPIGVAGVGLGLRYVPRGEPSDPGRLDLISLLQVVPSLPLIVFAISEATLLRTIAERSVLLPLALGALGLGAFAYRSQHRAEPLLDLRLVRNRVFAAAATEVFFAGAALFGGLIVMPLYFQLALGKGIVSAGLLLMAFSLGAAAAFPVAGSLNDRYGGGIVTLCGLVITALSTAPMALLGPHPNLPLVEVLQVLRGIGLALAGSPGVSSALAAVRPHQVPDASAEVNILSRVGGAIGSAIFVVLLSTGAHGPSHASFQATFWWLTLTALLALGAAGWLTAEQRRHSTASDNGTTTGRDKNAARKGN